MFMYFSMQMVTFNKKGEMAYEQKTKNGSRRPFI